MVKDNHPEGAAFSRTSPKFMKAELGATSNTVYLQRGFRHYGQPLESTLEAIVEVQENDECTHF